MEIKTLFKRNSVTVDHGRMEVTKVVRTPIGSLSRLWCRHEAGCLAKLAELGFRNAPRLISSTANSFVMEKIDGVSLRGREPIAERLFVRILDVVRELHGLGFAHGNLRPNNIFVKKDNEPILIDFETCCRRHSLFFPFARFRDHVRLHWLWQSRVVKANPELVRGRFPRHVVLAMLVIAPLTRFGRVVSSVKKRLKKFLKGAARQGDAPARSKAPNTRAAGRHSG